MSPAASRSDAQSAGRSRLRRFALPAAVCVAGVLAVALLRPAAATSRLDLHAERSLSAEKALEIAGFPGTIDLRGLPTLSVEAASALARHTGALELDGL